MLHEHLHQLLHQAGLWCRVLLQQSFLETFHHESWQRVSYSETSLELLGLGADVLFLPQHGLAGLHRGLLCQLLDQAGNNFFKVFLSLKMPAMLELTAPYKQASRLPFCLTNS